MEAEETMECLQEFPEHHKMILDRLNEQREQDRFTDITLIVDGGYGGGLRSELWLQFSSPFPPPAFFTHLLRTLYLKSAGGVHLNVPSR